MESALALIALVVVVGARLYFGRLAAQTLDALPDVERKRLLRASASGTY